MDGLRFWTQEGLSHMVPVGSGEFPEGFDVRETLKTLVNKLGYKSVIDFGCGYGRLCESFCKEKYLGLDVNEEALSLARNKYEGYRFELVKETPCYADIYLAYNVFLHLKDKELHEVLKRVRCKYLILSEILGKEWKRDGLPPVYNRDLQDYLSILRAHDLVLQNQEAMPYQRYADAPFYRTKNTDLSILLFKKLPTYTSMA